jgi:hypothetical protein
MIQALPISDLIDCTPRWKIGGRFVVVVFVLLWMDALSSFLDHLVVSFDVDERRYQGEEDLKYAQPIQKESIRSI